MKLFGKSDEQSPAEYFKSLGWTSLAHVLDDNEDLGRDAVLDFLAPLHCEESVLYYMEQRVI